MDLVTTRPTTIRTQAHRKRQEGDGHGEFGQVDSSLSRAVDGTGLGMRLARHLMAVHGGMLRLDSTKGQGATMKLRFPVARIAMLI